MLTQSIFIRILLFPLLAPFAIIYAGVSFFRNLFFDFGILPAQRLSRPVLSLGNITAGGTGKTPLTEFLTRHLQERNWQVGILSRGYRGTIEKVAEVDPLQSQASQIYGDEPTWLAGTLKTPVFVGPKRANVGRALIQAYPKTQLLIADDAFQHRHLQRDLNIVVIDATEPAFHYWPLPLGRGREDFTLAMGRADAVFLSKTNLADDRQLQWIRNKLNRAAPNIPKIEMLSRIQKLRSWTDQSEICTSNLRGQNVYLMSGIAQPQGFEKLLQMAGLKVVGHAIFADHHNYCDSELKRVLLDARNLKVENIVITQKDAVKLQSWRPDTSNGLQIWVSQLEMHLSPVTGHGIEWVPPNGNKSTGVAKTPLEDLNGLIDRHLILPL